MQVYGFEALIRVISHFSFVYLAFWSLQAIRYEQWFKQTNVTQIRLMLTLVAIVIGYTASSFFLETMKLMANFLLLFF